jgi:Cu/Ag efflux pump CusA
MDKESLKEAVLIGASEIATPTLVSTLTICIVFVSVVFLTGPAKYLFTPMALAVVFAMLASYILSRTLVPRIPAMGSPGPLASAAFSAASMSVLIVAMFGSRTNIRTPFKMY